MRTISFSDARSNLKQVLDRVVEDADATIITRRDADDVVVISLDTWNSWQETEYLLSSPANARRLMESIARLDAGKGQSHELPDAHGEIVPRAVFGVAESAVDFQAKQTSPRKVRVARAKPAKKKR